MGASCSKMKSHENINNPSQYKINNNMLLDAEGKDVRDYYDVVGDLGMGSIGAVCEVKKKLSALEKYTTSKDGTIIHGFRTKKAASENPDTSMYADRRYAMKTIHLNRVTQEFIEELENEIDILKTLDHPNIVKAYEVFKKKKRIYIIMELCSGGDLYARKPYSEGEAGKITEQLISAVSYMHKQGVVHRDLKFENIMFENRGPDIQIKVLDFGLSKKFVRKLSTMTEGVGTLYTLSPQVIEGSYTSQADIWSIGVITYILLSGKRPFYHAMRRITIEKIMKAQYNFDAPIWKHISKDAINFIQCLVQLDPDERFDADQALQHPWIKTRSYHLTTKLEEKLQFDAQDALLCYDECSELKKLALMVIAHKSNPLEIIKLRNLFWEYDTSKNGVISLSEFMEALKSSNFTDEEIRKKFESVDVGKHGVIYYTEFIAATLEAEGALEDDRLADAFDRLDSDDSGYISKANLKLVLGTDFTPKKVKKMISQVDVNRDGKISYDEFLRAFRKEKCSVIERVICENHATEDILINGNS